MTEFQPAEGLTKREYFAALAMQGLASIPTEATEQNVTLIGRDAVALADALIDALNKTEAK